MKTATDRRIGARGFEDAPFELQDARVVMDSEMCQGVVGALTRCPNGDLLTAFDLPPVT